MRRLFLALLVVSLAVRASADDQEPPDEAPAPETADKVQLAVDPGGHTASVTHVFFTPDGKQLVSASTDHTVRTWDAASGQAVKVFYPPGFGGLGAAALAPDGKTLALGSRYPNGKKPLNIIYIISLADGRVERVLKGHTEPVEALTFSPDGRRLASTSAGKEGTVRVWDPATGDLQHEFPFPGHTSSALRGERRGLAFSPDGGRLARVRISGPGDVLDLATGKEAAKLPAGWAVAWSPDGKTLAQVITAKKSRAVVLCDPDGAERLRLLDENATGIRAVAFAADSKTLLATWGESDGLRTGLFDVATGKPRLKPLEISGAKQDALSPDGETAATTTNEGGAHGLTLWQTADGKVVRQILSPHWIHQGVNRSGWSADGKSVTWSRPNRRSLNLEKLEFGPALADADFRGPVHEQGDASLDKLKNAKKWEHVGSLTGRSPTLVGKDRVAAALLGVIYLFDADTGKAIRRLQGHHDEVVDLAPSPDGRFLLSTSMDQTLRVWNLDQEKPLLSLYVNGNSNDWVVWTEEGYYAASPNGERLVGWKVDNGVDKAADFYPAERFRKVLYRPDVIQLVLAKGNVADALAAADAARRAKHQEVPRGAASPEKLLPPGAALALVDQSQLPKVVLKASAHESCPEQPIKSLRLLVDGRPLPDRQAAVSFADGQEPARCEETWTVELPPGKHRLSVLARSKDDTPTASNVVQVASPLPESERPVLHHLAVGVSAYDDANLKLNYADADARQLADAVAKDCAGPGNFYRTAHTIRLLNQEAGRSAVLAAIDAVRKEAKPNDLFLFSFAGHGVRGEEDFYLLTREADTTDGKSLGRTAVSGSALRERLADFPCQVLLLLDACHSGAFGAGAAGYRPGTEEAARALADVDVRVAVMCAALGHEEALEEKGHGLFTDAVVRALSHDPACFFDRQTGELNVYHLQAFVSQEVAKASDYRQTPYLKMPLASPPFVLAQFVH